MSPGDTTYDTTEEAKREAAKWLTRPADHIPWVEVSKTLITADIDGMGVEIERFPVQAKEQPIHRTRRR